MAVTGLEPMTTYFLKEQPTIYPNWPNDWAVLWVLIFTLNLAVRSSHFTYQFQTEYTFDSWLNVKERLTQDRCDIWSLNDRNGIRSHNHLIIKGTLNHLAKLIKRKCCKNLHMRCVWMSVLIMSSTSFRVNLHCIVAWITRNF